MAEEKIEQQGEVLEEQLDPEREARRRLALAQIRQYPDPVLRMRDHLVRWQWQLYPPGHRDRRNLAIHIATVPLFQAGPTSPYDVNPPHMPPYSWPTYAPYNNWSRVAYPLNYPYNAWPFIGPIYPFPKVPLGWRSVKLEWDDGYWWYSKVACKYDWWRLRFW